MNAARGSMMIAAFTSSSISRRLFKGKSTAATTTDVISARIKLKAYPAHREKRLEAAEGLFLMTGSYFYTVSSCPQ